MAGDPVKAVLVEIKNWERYNGRADVKRPSWFRMDHSIAEDPDFYAFSHEERWAWVYILCLASKKNSGTVLVHLERAKAVARLSSKAVLGAVEKLQSLGILLVDVTPTSRERTASVQAPASTRHTDIQTRQDIQTPDFDFSDFWEKYPRKIAKSDAQARFDRLIRSQEDFDSLLEAVAKFRAHHEGKGTEAQYIPHPATFLGTKEIPRWRDWLEEGNGKSDIRAASEFRGMADILAEQGATR